MRIKSEWTLAGSLLRPTSPHAQTCAFYFPSSFFCVWLLVLAAASDAIRGTGFHAPPRIGGETGLSSIAFIATQKENAEAAPSNLYERHRPRSDPPRIPASRFPSAINILLRTSFFLSGTGCFRFPRRRRWQAPRMSACPVAPESRYLARAPGHSSSRPPDLKRDALGNKYARKKKIETTSSNARNTAFSVSTFCRLRPARRTACFPQYKWEPKPGLPKPTPRFSAPLPQVWRGFCVGRLASVELARVRRHVMEDHSCACFLGKIYRAATFHSR